MGRTRVIHPPEHLQCGDISVPIVLLGILTLFDIYNEQLSKIESVCSVVTVRSRYMTFFLH